MVLDSGASGDTAALVAGVAALPDARARLARIGEVTEHISALLAAAPLDLGALGAAMTANHRLLAEVGVSTPRLEQLVDLCLGAGALGAKLAGAGGGGVVTALTERPDAVLAAAAAAGVPAFSIGVAPTTPR